MRRDRQRQSETERDKERDGEIERDKERQGETRRGKEWQKETEIPKKKRQTRAFLTICHHCNNGVRIVGVNTVETGAGVVQICPLLFSRSL